MKLTIIHNEMAPYRIPLFNEITKSHEVTVIFGRKKDPKRLWKIPEKIKFRWRLLPGLTVGNYVLNFPSGLWKELKKSDIVIIADNVDIYPLIVMSAVFTRASNKPIVLWVGHIETEYLKSRFMVIRAIDSILKRFIYSLADSFIVYSSKSRAFLIKKGAKPHKIVIGTTQYYPKELILDCQETKKGKSNFLLRVLGVGYFEKRKGFEYLIDAVCNEETIELLLGGTGEHEKQLKEKAEGCNNIRFLGYVDEKRKSELFCKSDIFVFPTLHDPWGFVVNEALYYGVPVITTNMAGASDVIINGKNGFVVEAKSSKAIRELLLELSENRKLLRKLKVRAKKSGKELTDISKAAETIEKAIKKATELHR